jgi:hypothetical protein
LLLRLLALREDRAEDEGPDQHQMEDDGRDHPEDDLVGGESRLVRDPRKTHGSST